MRRYTNFPNLQKLSQVLCCVVLLCVSFFLSVLVFMYIHVCVYYKPVKLVYTYIIDPHLHAPTICKYVHCFVRTFDCF